jgi:mono/diheme cytochrome c family protein
MKKKIVLVTLIILIPLLFGGIMLLARQAKLPRLVSRTDPPKISILEPTHDLGTVEEGVEIPYVFTIHNVGGEPLEIKDVSTSCGCTLLNLKDKVIAPGKTGELEVTMDTSMKQGYVKKSIVIFTNDPESPKKLVYLGANVLPRERDNPEPFRPKSPLLSSTTLEPNTPEVFSVSNPHTGLTEKDKAKIFVGNCAVCHVQQGKGKMGADLFQADCAMCHGVNAEGAEGPALLGNYKDPNYVKHIQKVTRYGSEKHISMPGFSRDAGGPLTDQEINSIVSFLEAKSEQSKAATPGG